VADVAAANQQQTAMVQEIRQRIDEVQAELD
jgi:hypothetical protein